MQVIKIYICLLVGILSAVLLSLADAKEKRSPLDNPPETINGKKIILFSTDVACVNLGQGLTITILKEGCMVRVMVIGENAGPMELSDLIETEVQITAIFVATLSQEYTIIIQGVGDTDFERSLTLGPATANGTVLCIKNAIGRLNSVTFSV